MTWTWRTEKEEILKSLGPVEREIATNEAGVSIKPSGTWGTHRMIVFKYADKDLAILFTASQSPKSAVEHGVIDCTNASYPLGPICEVLINDRQMEHNVRPLSTEEMATIKENITDFLTTAFRQSEMAIPPYPEQVEFY